MRFPKEFLVRLLAQIDLVNLISEHLQLKPKGHEFSACCPFHQEKTPSFTVSPEKQFFYCFGCQAYGNAFDFVMRVELCSFPEAVEKLSIWSGVPLPKLEREFDAAHKERVGIGDHGSALQEAAALYEAALYSPEGQGALAYLQADRGLTLKTLKRYRIGYAPSNSRLLNCLARVSLERLEAEGLILSCSGPPPTYKERFLGRIIFPILNDRAEVVGLGGRTLGSGLPKYLNSPDTDLFKKKQLLYGWTEARSLAGSPHPTLGRRGIILVEGYVDLLVLSQDEYPVVASLGTASSIFQLRKILRYFECLWVCYDGDAAGDRARWKLLERILPLLVPGKMVKFIHLPVNEDPDSFLRRHGSKAFQTQIEAAIPLSDQFLQTLVEEADLASLEGRTQALRRALSLLEPVPDPLFRQQMIESVTRRLGIPEISRWIDLKPKYEDGVLGLKKVTVLEEELGRRVRPPLRLAFALLLQNPCLVQELPIAFPALETLKNPLIHLLLRVVRQSRLQSEASLATRLEFWRGTHYYAFLSESAFVAHLIDAENQVSVLKESFSEILKFEMEIELKNLLDKSRRQGLLEAEKTQYMQLLYLVKNHWA